MLSCEGYKMFRGSALITPKNDTIIPYRVSGTFLYKPEYDVWYVGGSSYPAKIVSDLREE